MSDLSLKDKSLDISINYSGIKSTNSGRSAKKNIKKEVNNVQTLETTVPKNGNNKSNVSEISKQERLQLMKNTKQKYTITQKKFRCQSISNTINVINDLNEFDQWKLRIKFNQEIASQKSIIAQNEQSPEFKKIKRIVTLKKIRYPKSPTFIGSPQNKNNGNKSQKTLQNNEKSALQLQNVESIQNFKSSQLEYQQIDDLSEEQENIKLNKSDILNVNKQSREDYPLSSILQDPNEMKTSQKFLMRQIYQQQIRAIKSMNKVKNQFEKSKSFVQNNSQIQQLENLSPQNEGIQFSLHLIQPGSISSKSRLNNEEEANSPSKQQLNSNFSPLSNKNKFQINLQNKINLRLNNKSDIHSNHFQNLSKKNASSSNIEEKTIEKNNMKSNNLSQINSLSKDLQYRQLITDNSVQQLNSQMQQSNYEQKNSFTYESRRAMNKINQTEGLLRKIVQNQIKDVSKTLNNISQEQINNISQISQTVSSPQRQNSRKQILDRYNTQQFTQFSNLQVQVEPNYDRLISDISPTAQVNKKQLTPLSKILQPPPDQLKIFVPYGKQANLKSYLFQDDQDQISNINLSKQIDQQSQDNINFNNHNASQNPSPLLGNINRFQKYQKQLSSIRKKIIYDQEFYESEIKAIDLSYKKQLEVKGKQESIKTIDKALPFTNSLIKQKIKNLLHNGQFINPLPNFKNIISSNSNQVQQKQQQSNLIQRIAKQNKSSSKNVPKLDFKIVNRRKEVARNHHQSCTQNQILLDQSSFESRSPSFVNHYRTKSKQSQTNFIDDEIEDFNQDCYQLAVQMSDDSKLMFMKDQLQKYINNRNRTPLHQNFNKNKKLLYQNIQQRLDTI